MTQPPVRRGERFVCPQCTSKLDAHVAIDGSDDQPEPGSPVLCFYCKCASVVDELGEQLRAPTKTELAAMMRDPEMRAAMVTVGSASSPADAYRRMFGR